MDMKEIVPTRLVVKMERSSLELLGTFKKSELNSG